MTLKSQKIISAGLISIVVIGGFQALIYILNLNQPAIYLNVAFWIFAYLMFTIVFLYDLHIKNPGSLSRARLKYRDIEHRLFRWFKIMGSAFADRFRHLAKWAYLKQWLHFLLLPGFIFWASVSLFYINFGNLTIQELVAGLSSIALILDYWFLKEVFQRGKEVVDSDIFVTLSIVKIYAAAALYAAALSMLRYYCLNPLYFSVEVFAYTFLLIYQALYQHRLVSPKNIAVTLLISGIMASIGQNIYIYWGYNYFTAAIFLTVCYNLMWGLFHYFLDEALNRRTFLEIFIIGLILAGMVVSVTNFRARISDGCEYYLNF